MGLMILMVPTPPATTEKLETKGVRRIRHQSKGRTDET